MGTSHQSNVVIGFLVVAAVYASTVAVLPAQEENPAEARAARIESELDKAKNLTEAGHHSESVRVYSSLISDEPSWAAPYLGRAKALIALNEMELALESVNSAIDLSPDYSGDVRFDALLTRASVLCQLGFFQEAAADCEQLMMQRPDSSPLLALRTTVYQHLARRSNGRKRQGYLESARRSLERSKATAPQVAFAHGMIQALEHDYSRAEDTIFESLNDDEADADLFREVAAGIIELTKENDNLQKQLDELVDDNSSTAKRRRTTR